MTKFHDLAGQRFGRLTPILYNGGGWLCRCDCGGETRTKAYNLKSGHTQSCGCLQREAASKANTRHRLVRTAAYNSWASMKARCSNPNNPAFSDYGGRGISYAPEWETFVGFHADMGDCPDGMSIDRIDNNGGYHKGNCRWADHVTQSNNTRTTMLIEFGGETKSVTQWAKSLGWAQSKLQRRLARGWSIEKSLTTP